MKRQQLISSLLAAALCAGTAPAAMAAAADASPAAVAGADAAANRRADLQTLMDTLERVHPDLYANTPKADFEAKRAAIEADLASMSEIDFAIAAAELVALVRDSHTGVNINLLMDKLTYLPVNLARMHEGWVIAALPRSQSADLGSTVTAVNGIPIADVQARISAMVSADNRAYADRQTGSLLTIYDVLAYYGVADDPSRVTLTVRAQDGTTHELSLQASSAAELRQADIAYLSEQRTSVPATEADRSKLYFYKPLDSRTLYIQYNSCREDEALPMETFADQVKAAVEQNGYDRVIVDLRSNGGGSDGVILPLLFLLEEMREQDGVALYGLIGSATFSSALINAVELKQIGATLVGTPTGGSVDHFGEVSGFNLPNSGIRVSYSNKFIDLATLLDAAKPYGVESLPPDIPIEQTLDDWQNGRDTAVETILARKGDAMRPKSVLTRGALLAALGRAYAEETGQTLSLEQPVFSDVPLLNYLSPYAVWAQKNGIIYGETPSSLVPNRAVTRQELAAVLSRYAGFRGQTLPAGQSTPSDAAEISPWALDAVRSLTEAGVLSLENGAFRPRGTIDRTDLPGILDRLRAAAQ